MNLCRAVLRCARWTLGAVVGSQASAQTPGGWPLHGLDLGGRRYSPLAAIDTATVSRLMPLWTYRSGVTATFQATPIVVDTAMFVSLPCSGVAALDARTGRERWRYEHQSRGLHPDRGLAVVGVAGQDGRTTGGAAGCCSSPRRSFPSAISSLLRARAKVSSPRPAHVRGRGQAICSRCRRRERPVRFQAGRHGDGVRSA